MIFVFIAFTSIGGRLENAMGSARLAYLMLLIGLTANVAFLVFCFLMASFGTYEALFFQCQVLGRDKLEIDSLNKHGNESAKGGPAKLNLIFLSVCVFAQGFWVVLFGLIVVECLSSEETHRQLFMLPIQIPIK